MKPIHFFGVLLASSTLHAQTVNQATANPTALPAPTPYAIMEQGANHQVWQRNTYEQAPNGSIVPHVHKYTELATGLNHLVNGQWVASKEEIDIAPDGNSAAATHGQHQVYFPGDIYGRNIKLATPDGQTLQSQPLGLSYSDGSNSVLLAVVTNSTGAILPSGNQVIYTNAFDGLDADLLYTYTKAGFEQDIILREQPPDPVSLGLNPQTTRLQVLTEFFNSPQPGVTATTVPTVAGNLEDDGLSFGAMRMGRGKAFLLGTNSPSTRVDKRWRTIQGRQFLIEEVPIRSIAKDIDTLPPFVAQAGAGTKLIVSKNLILPSQRLTQTIPKTMFLAKATLPSQGLVLDYVTLNYETNAMTLQGDMTYYISGGVEVDNDLTVEGGTVVKYARSSSGSIQIDGNLICDTAMYRPAVFTAMDDNSVGESISGSSGSPSGYYGSALIFNGNGYDVKYLRMLYQTYPFQFDDSGQYTFSDIQVENCLAAFSGMDYNTIVVNNSLFAGIQYFFDPGSYLVSLYGDHLTVHRCNTFARTEGSSTYLANSLLIGVTNLLGVYDNIRTNKVVWIANDNSNVFQTVGGGSHYLTTDSPYRGVGTTNIDSPYPTLLSDLRQRTTYPPVVYSNVTFTTNLTLSPRAQRDTNAAPDLGYHYDPLDYAFGGCTANSNITFTAGTAVGWFRTTSGYGGQQGQGIYMENLAIASFQGTEEAPDYWARLNTVQENDTSAGYGPGGLTGGDYQYNTNISLSPEVHLSFTRCTVLSGEQGCHFRDDWGYLIVRANHCEFYDGNIGGYVISCYFTNCFMDRMIGEQIEGWPGDEYVLRNCTWIGGQVEFDPGHTAIPLSVRDCAFDGTTFTIANYGSNTNYADYDYNAFTNGAVRFPIGGSHDVTNFTSFNWQSSWLGNYYLPPGSPLLNKGDVPASQVGLYHFTIQTNQVPEGTNIVSIGYHYVAVDQYGNPLDSNGDGIPDYLEDANGNGIYDTGDLGDWQNLNLRVLITRPRNGSILP